MGTGIKKKHLPPGFPKKEGQERVFKRGGGGLTVGGGGPNQSGQAKPNFVFFWEKEDRWKRETHLGVGPTLVTGRKAEQVETIFAQAVGAKKGDRGKKKEKKGGDPRAINRL